MQEPASLTVRYVSRTAARSARRHLFVPIPKGSTWMPVRPRGRVSSSAGIAGPLTRRKRRWLVGVMTLAFQGYAIAGRAADDLKDFGRCGLPLQRFGQFASQSGVFLF